MFELIRDGALLAATITTGLLAGLFYAFSVAIMPGLRRADDHTFVTAMRRINVAILNGWFVLGFVGAPVLTALAAGAYLFADPAPALGWIVAAFALELLTLGVTVAVNIPLNNALERAGASEQAAGLAAARAHFEVPWARWNLLRAVASSGALGCLAWALMAHGAAR